MDEENQQVTTIEKPKKLKDAIERGGAVALQRNGGSYLPAFSNMAEVMEFAAIMAGANVMVGKAVRGNPGACMAVTMMAGRFNLDPFLLSTKAYITTDKAGNEVLAWESQAINAMILGSGALEAPLEYEYHGEGAGRYVVVRGCLRGQSKDKEVETPPVHQIGVKNSPLWKSDPDQQLAYYGSRAWCRRHAQHVLMGVYSVDEFDDSDRIVNITPDKPADPAERLRQSIEQSAKDRADADARSEPERKPEPGVQDAEFSEEQEKPFLPAEVGQRDDSSGSVEFHEAIERERHELAGTSVVANAGAGLSVETPQPDGDLLSGVEPEQPKEQAKESPAAREAEPPEPPPLKPLPSVKGVEAWAEAFCIWWKTLTRDERRAVGDRYDKGFDMAREFSAEAVDMLSEVLCGPAADEEV